MPADVAPPTGFGTVRATLIAWLAVVGLAAGGLLQWSAGEPPLLAGGASFLALTLLLMRALPALVALAGAFLVQLGTYLGALAVLPPLRGDVPLRPAVALGVLLLPCAAVPADVALHLWARQRPGPASTGADEPSERARVLPAIAGAMVGAFVLVVAVVVAGRMHPYGDIAWAAGGDSRNHVELARAVVRGGGLRGSLLTESPYFADGVLGLFMASHGRGVGTPGALLLNDLKALGQLSTLLGACWSISAAGVVAAFGPIRGRGPAVALAAASLLPLTGLGLGVLARDGFFSILLLAPLLCSVLVVATWLQRGHPGRLGATVAVGVLAVAFPVGAATWTPFYFVAGAVAFVPVVRLLRDPGWPDRAVRAAMLAAGAVAGLGLVATVTRQAGDVAAATGAIIPPPPSVSVLVPLLVLLLVLGRTSCVPRAAFTPYFFATGGVLLMTAYLMSGQPPGLPWNYYPAKFSWVWVLIGFPLLLVPIAHPRTSIAQRSRTERVGLVVTGSLAVLVLAVACSSRNSPVVPSAVARLGLGTESNTFGDGGPTIFEWSNPDAGAIALAVELGTGRPAVVWDVDLQNDRLTNFWVATYEDGRALFEWSYANNAVVGDLCPLLAADPSRLVATADPALPREVADQCGIDGIDITLVDR